MTEQTGEIYPSRLGEELAELLKKFGQVNQLLSSRVELLEAKNENMHEAIRSLDEENGELSKQIAYLQEQINFYHGFGEGSWTHHKAQQSLHED